ncbi:MAG: zinc ABC transporter substrate-binding protein [Lautropia sp.]|nr:zinc ABC transporter substrate-binding protein [Lautropia sp.]
MLSLALSGALTLGAASVQAADGRKPAAGEPLPVVASFSILADLVRQVGGDRVHVDTLVTIGSDTHVFQPGPTQVRQLAAARLVVVNGLGFEGWMPRLVKSSGYRGPLVEAARGVRTLQADEHHHHDDGRDHGDAGDHANGRDGAHGHGHGGHDHDVQSELPAHHDDHAHDADREHGDGPSAPEAAKADGHGHDHGGPDPHAWQDVANVRHYVANIRQALCEVAPADCEGFRQRAAAYDKALQELDKQIHQAIDTVPTEQRRVMVAHAAFGYYARAYGVEFLSPMGVSTEAEPSAAIVARLVRQAREQKVRAFFLEYGSDPRLMKRMAAELDENITLGELYSDTLSASNGKAPDYLSMMRLNTQSLVDALKP